MTHKICTSVDDEGLAHFQRVWDILLESESDLGSKLEQLFAIETDEFGLEYGFFSRIDVDRGTQRFAISVGPPGTIVRGKTVPLEQSYCRRTVEEPDGTFVVDDALSEGWASDPAYDEFELGTYVGTTVTVDDEVYGTLCFANSEVRDEPLADVEVELVQMHARWVSYELNRWSDPPSLDTFGGMLEESSWASPRIDGMMDILSRETRRFVLLSLLDDGETSLDVVTDVIDSEHVEVQLYHTHLPKLEEAGFIEWTPGATHVSRGPAFEEIEPLLRLLQEYTTGFSV